ncbi:MAG: hypothetical protein ACPGVU_03250 [Limisphaerales bacterium]
MEETEVHMGTLRLIRRITSDGELSMEEIFDLAHYLNDHEAAQNKWLGIRLWRQIERIFEDGEVSEHEHKHLGDIIVEIEEACAGVVTGATNIEQRADLSDIVTTELKLPVLIQTKVIAPEGDDEKGYSVDLRNHSCTCQDWFARHKLLPAGSFGRACKHIIGALAQAREDGEPITKQWEKYAGRFVTKLQLLNLGADPLEHWHHIAYEEGAKRCFLGWGKTEWASVFCKGSEGEFERFGFNLEDERWSYGAVPPDAAIISTYLKSRA